MTQVLAQGATLDSKYGNMLGFVGHKMIPPLDQLIGLILGKSNDGKSHLMQSCSTAIIFNTDLAGTGSVMPKARIWPGLDAQGDPCEPCAPGTPGSYTDPILGNVHRIELTWEAILERKKMLIDMAANQIAMRPRLVVLDTIDNVIALIQSFLIRRGQAAAVGTNRVITGWKDLHGQTAWDELYMEVTNFALDLRRAGYGVFGLMHLVDKLENTGNDGAKLFLRNVPRVTPNFFGRLYPLCEVVGVVEKKRIPFMEPYEEKHPVSGKVTTKYKQGTRDAFFMSFDSTVYHGVAKKRAGLPDSFELPKEGGWDALVKVYQNASLS